ncbi:MAG: tetratricopeptide repeat protein [Patescibacteria group bacterium]
MSETPSTTPQEKTRHDLQYLKGRVEGEVESQSKRKAESSSKEAVAFYEKGLEEYEKGDYQSAIEFFNQASKKFPRVSTIHSALSSAYSALGKFDDAISEADLAIQYAQESVDPEEKESTNRAIARAYGLKGTAYIQKEEFAKATENIKKSVELWLDLAKNNPDSYGLNLVLTLQNLGAALELDSKFYEAIRAYQKAEETLIDLAVRSPKKYDVRIFDELRAKIKYLKKKIGEI